MAPNDLKQANMEGSNNQYGLSHYAWVRMSKEPRLPPLPVPMLPSSSKAPSSCPAVAVSKKGACSFLPTPATMFLSTLKRVPPPHAMMPPKYKLDVLAAKLNKALSEVGGSKGNWLMDDDQC
jgi:hypothetical protein